MAELEQAIEEEGAAAGEAPDSLELLPGRRDVAFGDLDSLYARGVVRVLVSPSRTNYFFDGGTQRGFEYEMMREYEQELRKRRRGRFVMVFLPVPFNQLLPSLTAGKGDIAAAGITITPERQDSVAFSDPYFKGVKEIVVGHKDAEPLSSLADLAGRNVHVVRGSSFERHLLAFSDSLASAGADPVAVTRAPPYLEAEDLLELVDKGLIDYTIVDDHIGTFWQETLPNVVLFEEVAIHQGGEIAWAVRSDDTDLLEHISTFARKHRRGSLLGNIIFKRYYDDTKWVADGGESDPERIAEIRRLLEKYGEEYDFDWLFLGALAYQESKLDQTARSRAGAVGLFQIKPSIAKSVGVDDVSTMENNIMAGVRYLDHIRRDYINQEGLDPVHQRDLVLASYNAGPTRLKRMRSQAAEKGYDPDVWFDNVERIGGNETIRYVANINRHYYAMRLGIHVQESKEEQSAEY